MDDCTKGVFSTLPAYTGTEWDIPEPGTCPSEIIASPEARYGYAQGTSFASPIVAGIAALTWQVEPRLASEQVAEVLIRSADQHFGRGWNQYTGAGVVDGRGAVALARTYDVISPRAKGFAHRSGGHVTVRLKKVKDRSEPGREVAGHVSYGLLVSRDGGRSYSSLVSGRHRAFRKAVQPQGQEGQRVRRDRLRQQRQLRRKAARAGSSANARGPPRGPLAPRAPLPAPAASRAPS